MQRCCCVSIRRSKSITTSTAGFCRSCCARFWQRKFDLSFAGGPRLGKSAGTLNPGSGRVFFADCSGYDARPVDPTDGEQTTRSRARPRSLHGAETDAIEKRPPSCAALTQMVE